MSTTESYPKRQSPQGAKGELGSGRHGRGIASEEREDLQVLIEEVGKSIRDYSRKRPGVAGSVLFSIGFFVGWRLRPW